MNVFLNVFLLLLGLQREPHPDAPAVHGQAGVPLHHEALPDQAGAGLRAVPPADAPHRHRHPDLLRGRRRPTEVSLGVDVLECCCLKWKGTFLRGK